MIVSLRPLPKYGPAMLEGARGIQMLKIIAIAAVLPALPVKAFAECKVTLKHPVRGCPTVTDGPEDCSDVMIGKTGDRITSPAMAHIMESGRTYYCPSHELCYEMKDLNFTGCVFNYLPRLPDESKTYTGHFLVDGKLLKRR